MARGQKSAKAKITERDVLLIRELYAIKNTSQRELAHQYNISRRAIRQILYFETWNYLKSEFDSKLKALTFTEKRKGEKQRFAKLNKEKVSEIKKLIKKGKSDTELSKHFLVARSTIFHIRNGNTWKDI